MNKSKVDAIIDKLASQKSYCRCVGKDKAHHHVRIGDVLQKTDESDEVYSAIELLTLWQPCGLSKSLQQIVEESGFEKTHGHTKEGKYVCAKCEKSCEKYDPGIIYQLKDPSARKLFEFLNKIKS